MGGEDEGILYCLVLRGDQILSQSSTVNGNFLEFSRKVLEKSDNSSRCNKATYASGNYMLHYMRDGMMIYLCITDDEFERSKAFLFLSDIKKRFVLHRKQSKTTSEDVTFNAIISDQMEYYSRRFLPQLESINTYRNQLDELEEIEIHDIGSSTSDRVRLLPLPPKSIDIDDSASIMSSGTHPVLLYKQNLYKKFFVCGSIIVIILVVIILVIVIVKCSGFHCPKR